MHQAFPVTMTVMTKLWQLHAVSSLKVICLSDVKQVYRVSLTSAFTHSRKWTSSKFSIFSRILKCTGRWNQQTNKYINDRHTHKTNPAVQHQISTYGGAHVHTCVLHAHACAHAHMNTHTHTHTHTHTLTHTHTHTHTHTQSQIHLVANILMSWQAICTLIALGEIYLKIRC